MAAMTTIKNTRSASSLTSEDAGCTIGHDRDMELLEVLESGRPNSVRLRITKGGVVREISVSSHAMLTVSKEE
jgi:hypothetical protein